MERSLEAVHLTKTFGAFTAVSDLSLRLEGNKCVGFLGPNGAGKTTTLKIFTDLIRAKSGQAMINGVNVHTHKKKALASVGTLIETPEIYPALTPREALLLVAEMRAVPREERMKRVDECLGEVKMSDWADKKVGKFSKGMKQRVCVASAIVSDPQILILDEPTTGMDPRGMSEVREILKGLKHDRLVFMSSHLLAEVTDVCEEVAMIDHGKLLVSDTIANVTQKFSGGGNTVEVGFSRDVDDALMESVKAVDGAQEATRSDPRHVTVKFAGGLPAQKQLLERLVQMNLDVVSFRETSTGLEEAYLNLIKETL